MKLLTLSKRLGPGLALLISFLFLSGGTSSAQTERLTFLPTISHPFQTLDVTAPLCRFGINVTANVTDYAVDALRIGWYLNYGSSNNPARPSGIRYAQMIRLKHDAQGNYTYTPSKNSIIQIAQTQPGSSWFIGNEPDRRKYQDEVNPDIYAKIYHELYYLIKEVDPTAKILAGSIVQPTPVRLKYLNVILKTYRSLYGTQMPVDAWSIHNFILNEASCEHFDIFSCWGAEIPPGLDDREGLRLSINDNDNFTLFVEQIERFRNWMRDNGYRNTPLYLSEYGVLMPVEYGFPAERVNTFMTKTFDYLLTKTDTNTGYPADGNRLVQKLSWYSLTDTDYNGRLFSADTKQRTPMGDNFANYVAPIPNQADFYPISIHPESIPVSAGEPQTVTIKAVIANSGNTLAALPLDVRFYAGDPQNGGTQIGTPQSTTVAGCGETATVSIQWPNLTPGFHEIYVSVETMNGTIPESSADKANNTMSSTLFVGSHQIFAPRIGR